MDQKNRTLKNELSNHLAKGSVETVILPQETVVCHLNLFSIQPFSIHFCADDTQNIFVLLLNLHASYCDLYLSQTAKSYAIFPEKKLTFFSANTFQLSFPPQQRVNLVLLKAKKHLVNNYSTKGWDLSFSLFSSLKASIQDLQAVPHLKASLGYFHQLKLTPYLNRMELHVEVLKLWNLILFGKPKNLKPQTTEPNNKHSAMLMAKKYILENLEKPLTIAQIAQFVCQSESTLKRNFKNVHGTTIYQFIQSSRIWKAKALFDKGNFNVKHVAHQIGYSNVSHFSKAYKKHLSYTPAEYLKNKHPKTENKNR
jgi:AraC-type DNA-binding domain-containing proteins